MHTVPDRFTGKMLCRVHVRTRTQYMICVVQRTCPSCVPEAYLPSAAAADDLLQMQMICVVQRTFPSCVPTCMDKCAGSTICATGLYIHTCIHTYTQTHARK